MKKSSIILAASALMLCACNNRNADVAGQAQSSDSVNVTVSVKGSEFSKAQTQTESESRVNGLQIFIFDEDGILEDYKDAGAVVSSTIVATAGLKTVWAVVNASPMPDVKSIADLKSRTTDLSADNAADSFVMAGQTVTELRDGLDIPITVRRLVAKVIIKKVATDFRSSVNAAKTFILNDVYVINVAGDCNFAADNTPETWYNKLGHKDTSVDAFLYRSPKVTIKNKSSWSKELSFYVYPNPVDVQSQSATWSPRHTMLVLDCSLGGERMYYPIEMPVIERNRTYTVEDVLITRKGSPDPFVPVVIGESTVNIEVADWEIGLNLGSIEI